MVMATANQKSRTELTRQKRQTTQNEILPSEVRLVIGHKTRTRDENEILNRGISDRNCERIE